MSHVVCDFCGTGYPVSEQQCPLCGKKRDEDDLIVQDEPRQERSGEVREPGARTKGGRFSPKNVERTAREREEAAAVGAQNMFRRTPDERPSSPKDDGYDYDDYDNYDEDYPPQDPNRAKKIVCILLALAVLAIGAYIATRFILGARKPAPTVETTPPTTTVATEPDLSCTELELSAVSIKLRTKGQTHFLKANVTPRNTTDEVIFRSEDPAVATVSDKGIVTGVSKGETKITVTCGEMTAECVVVCDFTDRKPTEPTEPDETEPDETEEPSNENARLNLEDITLFSAGEEAQLVVRNLESGSVTWSSDNDSIVRVDSRGNVTAVGSGTTNVRARTSGGQELVCIVRCNFRTTQQTNPPQPVETEPQETDPPAEENPPAEVNPPAEENPPVVTPPEFDPSAEG